jgi:DNA-binding MarR family transcriptional regulator
MVNDKSVSSYQKLFDEGTISKRQAQVLKVLHVELGQATNRMIARKLDWDINRVTGRVSELREKGLIEHAGDFYDTQTERTVNLWKCK